VQCCDNLDSGVWTILSHQRATQSTETTIDDLGADPSHWNEQRFYRVVLE
jgi:hypothetical protein